MSSIISPLNHAQSTPARSIFQLRVLIDIPSVSQMTGWHRPNPRMPSTKDCPTGNTRARISSLGGNLSWESYYIGSMYCFSLLISTHGPKRKSISSWAFRLVIDLHEVWSRGPSSPHYLVDSAKFFRASPGFLTENIRIIDYGESFRPNNLSSDQRN